MNIVAIDTSGPAASCAVMKDGAVVQLTVMNHGLTHSETIMPALEQAMRAAGLSCAEVDVFAAVAGPGSFTGVRIGVCAVKGLAHAWDRPCARVDALEALAMNFYGFDGLACPILDARRGQVYCAAFDMRAGLPQRVMDDGAMDLKGLRRGPAKGSPHRFSGRRTARARFGTARAASRSTDCARKFAGSARGRRVRAGGGAAGDVD